MGCGATAGTGTHKPHSLKPREPSKIRKSPIKYEAPPPKEPKKQENKGVPDLFTLFENLDIKQSNSSLR